MRVCSHDMITVELNATNEELTLNSQGFRAEAKMNKRRWVERLVNKLEVITYVQI